MIYASMLDLLESRRDGLSHADIAKALGLEMEYHRGKNFASQTILHQLVYAGKVEKIGEARSAVFRIKKRNS